MSSTARLLRMFPTEVRRFLAATSFLSVPQAATGQSFLVLWLRGKKSSEIRNQSPFPAARNRCRHRRGKIRPLCRIKCYIKRTLDRPILHRTHPNIPFLLRPMPLRTNHVHQQVHHAWNQAERHQVGMQESCFQTAMPGYASTFRQWDQNGICLVYRL